MYISEWEGGFKNRGRPWPLPLGNLYYLTISISSISHLAPPNFSTMKST